jgi:hypothetical protein
VLVDPPPDLRGHPRVALYAVTGSGKSTLAARLAALTGAPHVSVDDLMWRPGWVQLTDEEQVEAIRPWAEQPAWAWTRCGRPPASSCCPAPTCSSRSTSPAG